MHARDFDSGLMASLEDCLVQELHADSKKSTGATSFVIAMLATRILDLPYLLKRADQIHVGKAIRLAFTRVLDITSSKETDAPASLFLAVRNQFLKIARRYTQSGFWKLIEKKGVGNIGLPLITSLNEHDVILVAAKQLGVSG